MSLGRPRRGQSWNGQRGSTLVEFALGSALLFFTLFAILEFGWAVWQYNMVANLAQEGARYASVHGTSSPKNESEVQDYVRTRAVGITPASITVTTTPATGPGPLYAGQTIQVQVQKSHSRFTALVTSGAITLSSRATMIVAR